jgi:hypothetical protein
VGGGDDANREALTGSAGKFYIVPSVQQQYSGQLRGYYDRLSINKDLFQKGAADLSRVDNGRGLRSSHTDVKDEAWKAVIQKNRDGKIK